EASRGEAEKSISSLKTASAEKTLSPSQVSRGYSLKVGDDGLITLSGGEITDYRKKPAGAMELLPKLFKELLTKDVREVESKILRVVGGRFDSTDVDETMKLYQKIAMDKGMPAADAADLENRLGANPSRVIGYADDEEAAPGVTFADTLSLHH